jgi:hypothetical protein
MLPNITYVNALKNEENLTSFYIQKKVICVFYWVWNQNCMEGKTIITHH